MFISLLSVSLNNMYLSSAMLFEAVDPSHNKRLVPPEQLELWRSRRSLLRHMQMAEVPLFPLKSHEYPESG